MHPYVTKEDMIAIVPADILTVAVDDRNLGDDVEEVWPIVASAASRRVDAILSTRYEVPFSSPFPAAVTDAAIIFAAHMLYLRRQVGDQNPFAKEAEAQVAKLERIARGEMDLTAAVSDADAVAIVEDSPTYRDNGRLML